MAYSGPLAATLVAYSFCLRDLTHRAHLTTNSYANHKALEEFYLGIVELADEFFETFSGCYERPEFPPPQILKGTALQELKKYKKWVEENRKAISDASNLQNIIDEIVSLVDRTLYKMEYLS